MYTRIASVTALSLLAACAGPAVKDSLIIEQAAMEQAKAVAADQDPTEIINSVRDLQIEAQKEDLYFYSPSYMEQAEDSMQQAESALKDKKPSHEIIAHALTAKKYFTRGLETKLSAKTQLKQGFDGLEMLKEIESDRLLKADFDDLLDDMKDLITLLEQGKATEALNDQKAFLQDVLELEISTLKKSYLTPAEQAFEKAEDVDAEDYAAKSLETAQKSINALEKLIETQPKQRELIKSDSLNAVRASQHAQHVSIAVEPLLKLKPDTAEQHVLFIESLIKRIGGSLQHEDVTHLPLDSQSIAIAQSAETIYRQAQAVGQKEQWEQEKQQLLDQVSKLEAELKNSQLPAAHATAENQDASTAEASSSAEPTTETESVDQGVEQVTTSPEEESEFDQVESTPNDEVAEIQDENTSEPQQPISEDFKKEVITEQADTTNDPETISQTEATIAVDSNSQPDNSQAETVTETATP